MNNNKAKMMSIHYMRAITILVIVIEHNFFWFLPQENRLFQLMWVLSMDWTAIFVAISGFLFQHLSYKYDFKRFYINKFNNLILPYLFVFLITCLIIDFDLFVNMKTDWFQIFNKFLLGRYTALWFMPMIILIFLFSPLFYILSKIKLSIYIPMLVLCFLLIERNTNQENIFILINNCFHYIPIFIIGMWFKQKFELINKFVLENIRILLFTLIFIFIIDYLSRIDKIPSYILFRTIKFGDLEKLLLFFLLIPNIDKYINRIPYFLKQFLDYIAKISFPIFFLHGLFIILLIKTSCIYNNMYRQNSLIFFIQSLCISFFVLCLCALVCATFKKILKTKSKFFIGY